MTAVTRSQDVSEGRERHRWQFQPLPRPHLLAWIALAALLIATGAFLFYETRGTTFTADEWIWVLHRRGNDLGTFLRPHNEHMSLVPIAIYRLLFATAGLGNYAPYRAVALGAHLLVGLLIFTYAARRIGSLAALLAAALILYLGPASENFLWAFQMGWLISLAAGLGALLMLDRGDRLGDLAACALTTVSLASSGIGLPIALGLAVDVLWGRRRWRDAWIVAAPLALYVLWWLAYGNANRGNLSGWWLLQHNIVLAPGFLSTAVAATLSALSGLAGEPVSARAGTFLAFGWPLLIVAVGLFIWRLVHLGRVPTRVLTLLTMLLSFWLITALRRADYSHPYESRYLYVGAVFIVVLTVELARGIHLSRMPGLLLAAAAVAAVVSNVAVVRGAARGLRSKTPLIVSETGALDIVRPLAKPNFIADPYGLIVAGPYFAAEKANGTPAASPAKIATEPEDARLIADDELFAIHRIALQRGSAVQTARTRPTVDVVEGGVLTTVPRDRACITFHPANPAAAPPSKELQVTVPPGGLVLRALGGAATISIRRFADGFNPVGILAASRLPATLRIAPDRAPQPWHVRIVATHPTIVCGLA